MMEKADPPRPSLSAWDSFSGLLLLSDKAPPNQSNGGKLLHNLIMLMGSVGQGIRHSGKSLSALQGQGP